MTCCVPKAIGGLTAAFAGTPPLTSHPKKPGFKAGIDPFVALKHWLDQLFVCSWALAQSAGP
jgi:hypothetical protein